MKTSDVVFLVGAGRSGTTWLQMMVGTHPAIATGQESQLFNNYLAKLHDQWQRELSYPESDKLRKHGISSYLDQQHFISLLRQFSLGVFSPVLEAKEGASVFLEKSPNNSFNIELIHACFPDARFIHLIRDGRDVVASMLAARKGWGRAWAPKYACTAASQWRDAVRGCLQLKGLTDQYFEVRYEDMLDEGPASLSKVFDFLNLPIDGDRASEIVDAFRFEKVQKGDYERDVFLNPGMANASGTENRPEPKGFFRKGVAGDWTNSLSNSQQKELYWIAGDLLFELGYAAEDLTPASKPMAIRQRELSSKLLAGVKRVGRKILG